MKDNQKENDPKKMSKADGFKNDKKWLHNNFGGS
jgi:hypothetical protein